MDPARRQRERVKRRCGYVMTNLDTVLRLEYSTEDELRRNPDPAVFTPDSPRHGWQEIRDAQGERLDVDRHAPQ